MKNELIGIMNVFNEADILEENLNYLSEQGINLLVVDNGSTDGSYEIAGKFLKKNVVRRPSLKTEKFSLEPLLEYDLRLVKEFDPDWVLWVDADEFLESPFRDLTLNEAIRDVAKKGYNVIQFNNFEFWPTEKDPHHEPSVRARLRYYSWRSDYHFKCWKWYPESSYDMHRPIFPEGTEQNICPDKFVMRHYKIRSYEHGLRKIFDERLKRIDPKEKAKGINVGYEVFTRSRDSFVIDSSRLTGYYEDHVWNLERKYDLTVDVQRRLKAARAYLGEVSQVSVAPLELLLRVYRARPDLQKAFPKVKFGTYEDLMDWASSVVLGEIKDSDRDTLLYYSAWYVTYNAKRLLREKEEILQELQKVRAMTS